MQQFRDVWPGLDLDYTPAEDADLIAGMPPGWARARAAAGGLGGRVIDGRVFVRRSSVLSFVESSGRRRAQKARTAPAHLRLVVNNDRHSANYET
jgi:hypothetical protein